MSDKVLFVVTSLPLFNKQGAAYSRILEYAKALVIDKKTVVYLFSSDYPDELGKSKTELLPNIFICGKKKGNNNKVVKNRFEKKKIINLNRSLFLKNIKTFINEFNGIRAGFVYPSMMSYGFEKEIIETFKKQSIFVFSERNELKKGIAKNIAFPNNLIKKILFLLQYPFIIADYSRQDKLTFFYDGNIAISTTMENFLKKTRKPVIRIPILTDIERFHIKKKIGIADKIQIGYTGTLTFKKDGLGELIKSIGILINKFNFRNICLNIYGTGYRGTIKKLELLIKRLDLAEYVFLHGKVDAADIPGILNKQDILVLTRPDNLQTRFGFSTKLAEYMASGTVVLTTDISDNLLYINDEKNGFIAESYLAEKVAEKLFDILSQKKYLDKKIVNNAFITALEHFNSKVYKETLSEFLFPIK